MTSTLASPLPVRTGTPCVRPNQHECGRALIGSLTVSGSAPITAVHTLEPHRNVIVCRFIDADRSRNEIVFGPPRAPSGFEALNSPEVPRYRLPVAHPSATNTTLAVRALRTIVNQWRRAGWLLRIHRVDDAPSKTTAPLTFFPCTWRFPPRWKEATGAEYWPIPTGCSSQRSDRASQGAKLRPIPTSGD
jgi:hypothetical protein